MKKTIHFWLILLTTAFLLSACRKMDETYRAFVVPAGLVYPGKAVAVAQSGRNRIQIVWPKGVDRTVVTAKVYWNSFADSIIVDIASVPGDTVKVMVNDLLEKNYTFVIRTFDAKGNKSVPVEINGGSFGSRYQSQLLTRPVNSTLINAAGKLTINWGGADVANGAYASEVKYTDVSGTVKTQIFPVIVKGREEKITEISDMKANTNYQFRTIFRPDSLSIDKFLTPYSDGVLFSIDKRDWIVAAFSSQHPGGDNAAANFIDGTEDTRWHSCAGCSSYPHWIVIDMRAPRVLTQFGVWRTDFDSPGGDVRGPDKFEFLTSIDNVTWISQGIFNFDRNLNGEQRFLLPNSPKARYFKFMGTQGPENNMVLGEISAYGL
ncbi:DUF4998 domain-containing protein [Pedobacter psychrodurus]|uniref:DUF4998 domain-containing protein n=1 Tax=Pedobacter psychrodurus TaxID=2530456 RepID=UPI00292CAF7D|nr:DUF4998 domain-containing protein [Pedobacter psychrodurus]